jgi:raffinose/stachyose/melibiose transport system permease protein
MTVMVQQPPVRARRRSPLQRLRDAFREPLGLAFRGATLAWFVIIVVPLLYMVSLSLRRSDELNEANFLLIPKHLEFDNYSRAFAFMRDNVVSIPLIMANSATVTTCAMIGALVAATLASYAFATLRFRGKRLTFYVLLLGLIVPIPVMLIPEFMTVRVYGLIGSRWSLILPYTAFGLPMPILILTAFFKELPQEIYDAAKIDGCSHFSLLWRIALPLARPALVTCVIFLSLQFWNEFSLALVIIQNTDLTTIPLAIAQMQGKGFTPWELMAAVMLMTSLPIVAIFTLFQRRLIEGLSHGALKG